MDFKLDSVASTNSLVIGERFRLQSVHEAALVEVAGRGCRLGACRVPALPVAGSKRRHQSDERASH